MMKAMNYKSAFSGFSVPDIGNAKQFYGEMLGLSVADRPEGLEVALPGGASIFLYASETNKPADCTVLNLVVEDIERAVDELVGKGVAMEHYDMGMVKTDEKGIARGEGGPPAGGGPAAIAWFRDPGGNIISLIQE